MISFKNILIVIFMIVSCDSMSTEISLIEKWCKQYEQLDCSLVKAIIRKESSFNPNAFVDEKSGSYGLMMIQCDTAKMIGLKYSCDQLFNPQVNIRFGIKYLKWIEKRLSGNSIADKLAAYNAGFDAKDRRSMVANCIKAVRFTSKNKPSQEQLEHCHNIKWIPRRCKSYNVFKYPSFPAVECFPGEYLNEEYVWQALRYYKYYSNLKR